MRPGNLSAAPTASEVNPAIRTPLRRVDPAFEFARGKAGEEHVARLGFPVAIAIGEKHDVRRARHNDAAARGHESVDRRQVRGPYIGRVHAAVAIGVTKPFYHAERAGLRRAFEFFVGLHPAHLRVQLAGLVEFLDVELAREIVSVQFGDKHLPALIPAHRRRRRDKRLAGDDLHAETLRQLERRGASLGRERLRCIRRRGNLSGGSRCGQQHHGKRSERFHKFLSV